MRRVAVLYIDPRGPYPKIEDQNLDLWDEARDALTYDGDAPIVAHPDCGPWGRLYHMYRGSGHACGPRAVEQVRRNGGVIEHPAHSKLWKHAGLPAPGAGVDAWGGYTIAVNQSDWGHCARKPTWIYLCRTQQPAAPPYPGRAPTHWIGGGRGVNRWGSTPVPVGILTCSAQQRRRTPPLFAQWLIDLARSAY